MIHDWKDTSTWPVAWEDRTRKMAELIADGESVIEFGCGNQVLSSLVSYYTAVDLYDRGNGTIICDLNAETLPEFKSHDVAFLSGVIEYINDVPRLIEMLSETAEAVVCSYNARELSPTLDYHALGWMNHFGSNELEAMFRDEGFTCNIIRWLHGHEYLYRFEK